MKAHAVFLLFFVFVVNSKAQEDVSGERELSSIAPKMSIDTKQKFITLQFTKTVSKIDLNIPKNMTVESKPEYYGNGDFAIVALAASEAEAATTLYYALNGHGKKIWFLDLLTFNAAPPLIEKDFVYLSGMSKVLKVDKKNGRIVWSHDNLYENKKYEFNGADSIMRKEGIIIFSPKVHVKDDTGKLVEVL